MEEVHGEQPPDPALEKEFRLWLGALADQGHALPGSHPVEAAAPLPSVKANKLTPSPVVRAGRPPTDVGERPARRRWPAAIYVGALAVAVLVAGYHDVSAPRTAMHRPPPKPALTVQPEHAVTLDETDLRQAEMAANIAHTGEALAMSGDTAGALRFYLQSLSIQQELASRHPHETKTLRGLASGWDKVADTFSAQGNTTRALEAYREAEAAWAHCAHDAPGDRDVQRSWSLTCLSLGNLLLVRNDPAGAVEAIQRGVSRQEELCRQEPDNTAWQEDLALGYSRLSDALDQRGDNEAALPACRRALTIDEALVASDPTNLTWQGDLAAVHGKVGDLLLNRHDADGALQAYTEANSRWEKLMTMEPTPERRRASAETKDRIGQTLEAQNQPAAALPFYQQALGILANLTTEAAGDQSLENFHAMVCFHLGRAMANCQPPDRQAASAALSEARDRLTRLESAGKTYPGSEQTETLADVERLLAELGKQ